MPQTDPMADAAVDRSIEALTLDGMTRDADIFYVIDYWVLPEPNPTIRALDTDFQSALEAARGVAAECCSGKVVEVADGDTLAETFDSWVLAPEAVETGE